MACDPWPIPAVLDCTIAPEDLDALIASAERTLWAATGRRFGVCGFEEEFRSCGCGCDYCCDGCRLELGRTPVDTVYEVFLPGEDTPYDPTLWYQDGNEVVALEGHWPTYYSCTTTGLRVHYTAGSPPPEGAEAAMGGLVCGMATGGTTCSLPGNLSQLARQGVTLTFTTGADGVTSTGIALVDSWIRLYHAPAVPSRVAVPDRHGYKRRMFRWDQTALVP